MNPNQALLEALQSQRNSALDNAVAQYAQIAQLKAEIEGLRDALAEARKPKRKTGEAKRKP